MLHLVVHTQGPDDFVDSSETSRSIVRRLVPLYLLLLQSETFSQFFLAQSLGDPRFDQKGRQISNYLELVELKQAGL